MAKKAFQRSIQSSTPYARPPSANPSMLKKLISAGAHKLFAVFRKPLPQPPEINEEPQDVLPNQGANANSATPSSAATRNPLSCQSITWDLGQPVAQKSANSLGNLEYGFVTPRSRGMARGPPSTFSHQVLKEETASPAELAKYYMASRPIPTTPVSANREPSSHQALKRRSSVLDVDIGPLRRIRQKANPLSQREKNTSHTPRQDSKLLQRTPITTVVQKTRGRSALYTMARPKYSRSPSTFTQQALKRRSSVLDDDIGPLRRIRQKANLLTPVGTSGVLKEETAELAKYHMGSRYASVPAKSTQAANKILQQLDDTWKNKAPMVEFTELPLKVTEVPQKKHAFQMSAPDAYFEIDDDEDDNGHVSLPLEENNKPETSAVGLLDKCPKTDLGGSVTTTQTSVPVSAFNSVAKNDHVKVSEQVGSKEAENVISTPSPKTDLGGSVNEQGLGFKIPISSPSVATTQTSVPVSAFNSVTKNVHVTVSVSNKDENGNDQKSTNMFGKSSTAAVSAATSTDGVFSFGTSNNLTTLNTTPSSNPPSLAPFSASGSTSAITTATATTTPTPAVIFSTSVSPQVFSFGSATSTAPSTSVAETGNSSSSSPFAIIIII